MSRQWSMWKSAGNSAFFHVGHRLTGEHCPVRVESDRGKVHIFLAKGAQAAWLQALRGRLASSPSLVEDMASAVFARGDDMLRFPLDIGPPERLDDSELMAAARSFFDLFLTYCVEHAATFVLIETVSAMFKEHVEALAPSDSVAATVAAYSRASQPAYPQRLASALADISDPDERVRYLAREAPWLGNTDPLTTPLDLDELRSMALSFQHPPATARPTIEIGDSELLRQYQYALYLKDTRNEYINRACFNAWGMMSELARRLRVEPSQLAEFLPSEYGQVDLEIERVRRSDAWLIEYDGSFRVRSGQEARECLIHDRHDREFGSEVKLRGISGAPGRIQGVVQLVFTRQDVSRFERGRVMVAASTNPAFIMAMARAAAFVTDDGGLGSHAAIVAREMSKPCIVGTGSATQLLRDGDLVDVDADRGEVTLLERRST